jgi:hypothetical protein
MHHVCVTHTRITGTVLYIDVGTNWYLHMQQTQHACLYKPSTRCSALCQVQLWILFLRQIRHGFLQVGGHPQ